MRGRVEKIMTELKAFLLWCSVLNYAVMTIWAGVLFFSHDWLYALHNRWIKMSVETFNALHYGGLSIYKIGALLLNVVPLVALYIIG